MYFKDSQTGQIFKVNGNTNQIEIVSAVPSGTSLSQGQTMSQVANAYGVSLPGGKPPTASTPPTARTIDFGATNAQPKSQLKQPIPDDYYSSLTKAVASGQISGQQAVDQLQSLVSSGQYTDTSVNQNKLFPTDYRWTNNGQTYGFSSNGAPVQISASTQTSRGNGTNASAGAGITKQLDLGMNDPEVANLQKFLNANGFPVAQSGPGSAGNETSYFGPATQAALEKYQASKGIVSSGDPTTTGFGRVGPTTLQSIQGSGSQNTQQNQQSNPQNTQKDTIVSDAPTGSAEMDAVVKKYNDLLATLTQGFKIDPNLDPSQHPEIIKQFLDWSHQVVDPQTSQLIKNRVSNINADLANQAAQFGYNRDSIIQTFGTNLASEQESAGGAGTAFSGQRGINEGNLVAGANRSLASLGANTAFNVGNTLRSGAADVGSSNTSQFSLPSILGGTVSTSGGQRGTYSAGSNLDYGYNPSDYAVSNFGNAGATNVNNQQADYLKQYSTLAGNNSNAGRSVSDLFGLISGKPAGASGLSLT